MKLFSGMALFVLLFISAAYVSAQDVSPSVATSPASKIGGIQGQALPPQDNFQKQLLNIKDTVKQAIVDRIVNKMGNVNRQRTNQMTKALDTMKMVLEKLSLKIATAKSSGKDTTAAEDAFKQAQAAISAAETAVAAQAAKNYTPATLTDDATLKNIIGAMVSKLQSDLQTTHKLVVDAKQALMRLAQNVAQLQSGSMLQTPMPVNSSPSAVPTIKQ